MPPKVQALAVLASLGLLTFILYLIRRGRLREEHALLWLMAGSSILVLSAWRGSLTAIARALGIGYAPSLLFAVGLVFTLLILLAQTAVMSRVVSHSRDLAQDLAILQWRIQELEEQLRRGPVLTAGGTSSADGPAEPSSSAPGEANGRQPIVFGPAGSDGATLDRGDRQ